MLGKGLSCVLRKCHGGNARQIFGSLPRSFLELRIQPAVLILLHSMAQINYRTINIDAYDPESALNFPLTSLLPSSIPSCITTSEAANVGQQIRQLLRSGDAEGALQRVLDTAPLGGDEGAKQVHLSTVLEVLQGIRQSDVARILGVLVQGEGGMGRADCLMKYLYVRSRLYSVPPREMPSFEPGLMRRGLLQIQGYVVPVFLFIFQVVDITTRNRL